MIVATYQCSNGGCKAKMTDRGEAGAKFSEKHTCGRCGQDMTKISEREIVAPVKKETNDAPTK